MPCYVEKKDFYTFNFFLTLTFRMIFLMFKLTASMSVNGLLVFAAVLIIHVQKSNSI